MNICLEGVIAQLVPQKAQRFNAVNGIDLGVSDIEELGRWARNKPVIVGCGSGSSGISLRDLVIESIAAVIKCWDVA